MTEDKQPEGAENVTAPDGADTPAPEEGTQHEKKHKGFSSPDCNGSGSSGRPPR